MQHEILFKGIFLELTNYLPSPLSRASLTWLVMYESSPIYTVKHDKLKIHETSKKESTSKLVGVSGPGLINS